MATQSAVGSRVLFSTMRRLVTLLFGLLVVAACTGQPYEASYAVALETLYPDGVPDAQQRYLEDGRLTEQELQQATQASDACAAAVPGIASVEPLRWVEQEGDFDGGTIRFADGADELAAVSAAQDCSFEHMGLIEYAWLDQYYFGGWTEESPTD